MRRRAHRWVQSLRPTTGFCPDRNLTRAEFATFITRALDLPNTNQDFFIDDNGHVLEGPINRIAAAGITVGCNPPTNNRFCPNRVLTRGETATLLTRALNLPHNPQRLPLANWSPISCGKGGITCSVLIETFSGRTHLVQEGLLPGPALQSRRAGSVHRLEYNFHPDPRRRPGVDHRACDRNIVDTGIATLEHDIGVLPGQPHTRRRVAMEWSIDSAHHGDGPR